MVTFEKSRTTWWINFFKDLVDRGVFLPGNIYHNECIRFCFNELLQHDLDFVVLHWNTHYIQQSRHDTVPGRPDELFFLPERSGGENHLQYTTPQELEEMRNSADPGPIDNDNDYQQYYQYVCEQEQIVQPKTWKEALTLFQHLLTL